MRFHIGLSLNWKSIKKWLIPIGIGIALFLGYSSMTVYAAPTDYQQIFSTDQQGTLTTVDSLSTFPVGYGTKFTYYQFKFTDLEIEKGKTYHMMYSLYGDLADGFYAFDPSLWEFSSYDPTTNKSYNIPLTNFTMSNSGQYRVIEFDFFNPSDNKIFRLSGANPNGILYYSWSSASSFGWYNLTVTKIADNEDALINQNEVIIGQNQQQIEEQEKTNEKLDDLNDKLTDSNVDEDSGNSFFDNFSTEDNGGISGIITAPLTLINSLLDNQGTCTDLEFPILGKDVAIPSGCMLWDKVPNEMETIIQMLVCGTGAYFILTQLFKDINDLKDPNKQGVSTLDL